MCDMKSLDFDDSTHQPSATVIKMDPFVKDEHLNQLFECDLSADK